MLNSREWAIIFWFGVLAVWALSKRDIRTGFVNLLRSFLQPKILALLGLMAVWVALEIWGGAQLGMWKQSLIKDSAIWFATFGLVLFFNFTNASKDPDFLRNKLIAALVPIALLEVVLDIFVFPLIVELILQPLAAVLAVMAVASKIEERFRPVERLARACLGLIGFSIVARAAILLITGWDDLDKTDLLLRAFLPGWLTVGVLPFIYVLSLYSGYELAFMQVNWGSPGSRSMRLQRQMALLICLHVNAYQIGSFAGPWPQRLAVARSFTEACNIVRVFRAEVGQPARGRLEAQ